MNITLIDLILVDMEEPFSESDDDTESKAKLAIASRRLNLPIARGRVRSLSGTVPIVGYRYIFIHSIQN